LKRGLSTHAVKLRMRDLVAVITHVSILFDAVLSAHIFESRNVHG
jgi:hypothetical protein